MSANKRQKMQSPTVDIAEEAITAASIAENLDKAVALSLPSSVDIVNMLFDAAASHQRSKEATTALKAVMMGYDPAQEHPLRAERMQARWNEATDRIFAKAGIQRVGGMDAST